MSAKTHHHKVRKLHKNELQRTHDRHLGGLGIGVIYDVPRIRSISANITKTSHGVDTVRVMNNNQA